MVEEDERDKAIAMYDGRVDEPIDGVVANYIGACLVRCSGPAGTAAANDDGADNSAGPCDESNTNYTAAPCRTSSQAGAERPSCTAYGGARGD